MAGLLPHQGDRSHLCYCASSAGVSTHSQGWTGSESRLQCHWHSESCTQFNTVDSRYLALVGSQNSRARVKWFSRYLARRRRLANSGSQTHIPRRLQLSNSMLSDNRGTYVSRISTHIDIAPATNHNKQHYILIIMQQNCQITRCARQHDGFCVEISQTTSRLDRKQKWLHACAAGPVWPRFTKVGWASRWQIRESHFK